MIGKNFIYFSYVEQLVNSLLTSDRCGARVGTVRLKEKVNRTGFKPRNLEDIKRSN